MSTTSVTQPQSRTEPFDEDLLQADVFDGDEEYELEFDPVTSERVLAWVTRHIDIAAEEQTRERGKPAGAGAQAAGTVAAEDGDESDEEEDGTEFDADLADAFSDSDDETDLI